MGYRIPSVNMKSIISILLLLLYSACAFGAMLQQSSPPPHNSTHYGYEKIEWKAISNSEVIVRSMPAVGIEENHLLILCRARHNEHWVPGKLWVDDNISCHVPENGRNHRYKDFQILSAPEGTTSWVASSGTNLPSNLIIGGSHPSGESAPVCRMWVNGQLIPGKYWAGQGGKCFVARWDGEVYSFSFEVLVKNQFGVALGV